MHTLHFGIPRNKIELVFRRLAKNLLFGLRPTKVSLVIFKESFPKSSLSAYFHLGIYYFPSNYFRHITPSVWSQYDEDIEMNALLSHGQKIQISQDCGFLAQTCQVNTEEDLSHVRKIL